MKQFDKKDGDFCLRAISDNVLLTAKVNLADGRHVILKKADGFKSADQWVASYPELVKNLVAGEWVHPMEGQQFLQNYEMDRLRRLFYYRAHYEVNYFRELYLGEYVLMSIEAFSTADCSPENPWIFMVIKIINASSTNKFYREAEYYYSRDPLTHLWNRGKYEKDVDSLTLTVKKSLFCLYVDAVGLHELNNRLGHKAGDQMLCAIADELKKQFPSDFVYRIGGDEYVVLGIDECREDMKKSVHTVKEALRSNAYEISAGWAKAKDGEGLRDAISEAENAMREDKAAFYRSNGTERRSRMMNTKLESLLLAKQDASEFLDIISDQFKGVYIVDMKSDRCRYIYIPPYFLEILERNKSAYLPSIKEYIKGLVRPEYYDSLEKICDYGFIRRELSEGRTVLQEYQKENGEGIRLSIYPCHQEGKLLRTTIWIFTHIKE